MCGCLSCVPHGEPGLQPRHVPRLGIKLVTLWFTAHTQATESHQPGLLPSSLWVMLFSLFLEACGIYVLSVC